MSKTPISIRSVSSIVKKLLIEDMNTRDSDDLLVLKVWADKNPKLRDKTFTFIEFSKGMLNGDYPSYESISRDRRKLQEEFVALRGKSYKERHKHQEVIKEELNDLEIKAGGTP